MKQSNIICKILKITLIIFLVAIFINTGVYAAINDEYSSAGGVTSDHLTEAVENSSVLEAIARLIYAVGRMIEWLLGVIFRLLTGSTDFPWADKIVFNAVPLLDVNFINPDKNSFVYSITKVLQSVYSTIFGIAFAFFGITVMITAIKLVLSTIASEKAKYKKAITDWLLGLVLLFCIHYFISFVFYLNEQLVKVASNLVTDNLKNVNNIAQVELSELGTELINSMGETVYTGPTKGTRYEGRTVTVKKILEDNRNILEAYMRLDLSKSSNGVHRLISGKDNILWMDTYSPKEEQKQNMGMVILWAASNVIEYNDLVNIYNKRIIFGTKTVHTPGNVDSGIANSYEEVYLAIEDKWVKEIFGDFYSKFENKFEKRSKNNAWHFMTEGHLWNVPDDINTEGTYMVSGGAASILGNDFDKSTYSVGKMDTFEWLRVIGDLIDLKRAANPSKSQNTGKTLIKDLADYFRRYSYEIRSSAGDGDITGIDIDKDAIRIQNMIMYAILVVQSLILFIAYVKRLFYVVILAMMAPIVVVMDFFQGFGK